MPARSNAPGVDTVETSPLLSAARCDALIPATPELRFDAVLGLFDPALAGTVRAAEE